MLSWNTVLFVPGARPDRFAKAAGAGADGICIDLEDAVAEADKDRARADAIAALHQLDLARTAIRINGLMTRYGLADLLALADAAVQPRTLFVPMVESPVVLLQARAVLGEAVALVPLIETVAGLEAAPAIAAAPGVAAIMFGGGDFAAQLGIAMDWEPLLFARSRIVAAAAAAGIAAIDVPYIALDDEPGLEAEARRARALGFAGKALIHPAQLPAVRRAFRPSAAEIDEARRAIAAYDAAGGQAIRHDGRMLEAPIVARYQRILAMETQDHA